MQLKDYFIGGWGMFYKFMVYLLLGSVLAGFYLNGYRNIWAEIGLSIGIVLWVMSLISLILTIRHSIKK